MSQLYLSFIYLKLTPLPSLSSLLNLSSSLPPSFPIPLFLLLDLTPLLSPFALAQYLLFLFSFPPSLLLNLSPFRSLSLGLSLLLNHSPSLPPSLPLLSLSLSLSSSISSLSVRILHIYIIHIHASKMYFCCVFLLSQ